MVEGALDSEIFNKFVGINQQCVAKEGNMKRIRPEKLRRGNRIIKYSGNSLVSSITSKTT